MAHDSFYGSVLTLAAAFFVTLTIGRFRLGGVRGLYEEHKKLVIVISGELFAILTGALAAQAGFLDDTDLLRGALLFLLLGQFSSTLVGITTSED